MNSRSGYSAAALAKHRQKPKPRRRLGLFSRVVLAIILLPILWLVGLGTAIFVVGQHEDLTPSDAIVVLGAAQYQGRPSPVFKARLDHAYSLYRSGKAPVVIVTGGKQPGDLYTEGQSGVRYLRNKGIPQSHLLAVGEGHNTLDSLRAVADAMKQRQIGAALIVSDRFHVLRSMKMASDFGLEVHGAPTSSPIERDRGTHALYLLREVAAYTAYVLGLET